MKIGEDSQQKDVSRLEIMSRSANVNSVIISMNVVDMKKTNKKRGCLIVSEIIIPIDNLKGERTLYRVDTNRESKGYEYGDLICYVEPFHDIPLGLQIAIRANGDVIFRGWAWNNNTTYRNHYLHTDENPDVFVATAEQIDTVNGLFSGRILFEGLKIAVGATTQAICPINKSEEEKMINKKIYTC